MNNAQHNASFNRRRDRIHRNGVPTFGKRDVSTKFNCIGCRKRKDGFRLEVYYIYESKNNPEDPSWYGEYKHRLGYVCSEVCYDMAVMRFS